MKATTDQMDLFVTYLVDLPLRDQRDTMERPFFSLSKSRTAPIEYRKGDLFVRVSAPPEYGLATIYDADVLIWAASQITDARNHGIETSSRLMFEPYNLLRSIKRGTAGKDYAALRAALKRLTATTVETNVNVPEGKRAAMFHWLERWTEETDAAGNSRGMTIELPRWIYEALTDGRVLTVHPDYFELTSGLSRWLYRVVRKHGGNQEAGWAFTMRQLYEKSGSTQRFSDFCRDVRRIVEADELPEYHLTKYEGDRGDEAVHFVRRTFLTSDHPAADRNLLQERGKRRTRPKASKRV
jgi:plasmid replication initiation protein